MYVIRQGFGWGSGMCEAFSGGSNVWASLGSRYFLLEACAQGMCPGSSRGGLWRRCSFRESRDSPRLRNCGVAGFAGCGFNQFWGRSVLNRGLCTGKDLGLWHLLISMVSPLPQSVSSYRFFSVGVQSGQEMCTYLAGEMGWWVRVLAM